MKKLMLALLGSRGLALFCSGAWAWQVNINGTANCRDHSLAVAVDAAGDVVAAGSTTDTGTFEDFTVVKLSGIDGSDF